MSDENELLFDKLYEKTKDCGRVQFIKLLMQKEREIQELKEKVKKLSKWDKNKDSRNSRQRIANKNLLKKINELKKQLEEKNKPQIFIDTQDMEERYAEGLYQDYLEEENKKYKNQQKEFIEYLTSYIDLLSNKPDLIEETEIDILEEILSKYKSIIGDKDE